MNSRDEDVGSGAADTSERSFARLLKLSGERGSPSHAATDKAHAAAFAAWQSSLKEHGPNRWRRFRLPLAAALATVAIGVLAWITIGIEPPSKEIVARVVTVTKNPTLVTADGERSVLAAGTPILSGTELRTGEGRVSLIVAPSLSLRANTGSHLRFDAPDRVRLLAGAIYVDSGGLGVGSALRIMTPVGEVSHVGTQFQIVVSGASAAVMVREGRVKVSLERNSDAVDIAAGELVNIDPHGGVSREIVPSFGSKWEWASLMAEPLDIESRPLTEFLAWMVREHGWQLRYRSAEDEQTALSTRLHGALQASTPMETLRRVSLITGLDMRVENGTLLVGRDEAGRP